MGEWQKRQGAVFGGIARCGVRVSGIFFRLFTEVCWFERFGRRLSGDAGGVKVRRSAKYQVKGDDEMHVLCGGIRLRTVSWILR